jgi:antitoxin (DNA-binding transcriptional repressor) of toxin-antitoxin stability system
MRKTTITVTEASRNFADCVNRARYQNMMFVLMKNNVTVAHLVPAVDKVCSGRDLAEALASTNLQKDEAQAWRQDLRTARKRLNPPTDKWR